MLAFFSLTGQYSTGVYQVLKMCTRSILYCFIGLDTLLCYLHFFFFFAGISKFVFMVSLCLLEALSFNYQMSDTLLNIHVLVFDR